MGYAREDSLGTLRFIILVGVFFSLIAVSILAYSASGYVFTGYPNVPGEFIVCIEGRVHPVNQTIVVYGAGGDAVGGPVVSVNNHAYLFNATDSKKPLRHDIDTLRLGCNSFSFKSDSAFRAGLEYHSVWRPRVRSLQARNLAAGRQAAYFIESDADRIMLSRFNLTDSVGRQIMWGEFEGARITYTIDEPGNYRAFLQVFDGVSWSDIYVSRFTVHVMTKDEIMLAEMVEDAGDDIPLASLFPPSPHPKDSKPVLFLKRGVNGAYIIAKMFWNMVLGTWAAL
jgi:hypothetical protein